MVAETRWDKWLAPILTASVIGGIVWGIQLNAVVQVMATQIGTLQGQLKELVVIVRNHEIEAEEWKRRIVRNSDAIERMAK